jgi:hypothetical protein
MGTRSGRSLQVCLQDGRALVGGNLFEDDLLPPSAAQRDASTGCPDVLDPLDIVAKHRDEVALSTDHDHCHRK